jgi:hypothetical protein
MACSKQTAKRTEAFIRFIRKGSSAAEAARAIGVDRATVYRWRDADPAFKAAWLDAAETITEEIESALARNALAGDTVSQIFWLKAHRPDIYNRKQVVSIGGEENAPPVLLAAGQPQAGAVIILPDNHRQEVPEHMRPPPGWAPRIEIEGTATPMADEIQVDGHGGK